jgi:hypothetical protein
MNMTVVRNRDSVMAIVVESTEGTAIVPSAAGEYVALQEDVAMSPNSETLVNAEIKSSLGQSQPIVGRETASASFSHYLKASGTEGTASEMDEVLTAVFGAEEVVSTEYNTVAGSTASIINVDTGEGASFSRGEALHIKDQTNGHSIRNVLSISSDSLPLGFNVGTAPGTGVNLGKAVFYSPADSGHQSLCLWHYLGNAGAVQMVSGARPTEFGFSVEPGALINANYSFEGLKYHFNPITIDANDTYLDFTDDQGTVAAIVTAKTYKDPHELADAIAAAMNALTTETITCVYSNTTGKFTIATSTSAVLSLLWNTGGNTANTIGDAIGFTVAADDTGATTYTSDDAISFVAAHTPAYDSSQPLKGYYQEVLLGDSDDVSCLLSSSVSVSMNTARQPFDDICAETGFSNSIINGRSCTVTITSLLEQYEADKFRKFREGEATSFCVNVGEKDAQGNWTAGSVVNFYIPTCVITSYNLTNQDGLIAVEMELQSYVDSSGNGEVYLNML